jgi:GxxExxY protein
MMNEDQISQMIVHSALEVHRTLGGPGLLESVYEEALVWELRKKGLKVLRQVTLPVSYKGVKLDSTLRIDLMVHNLVLVECKSTTADDVIFESQLLTYLRLTGLKLGLVINFGHRLIKDGIHRVVNGL